MSNLPIIEKELFVRTIESVRLQLGEDKVNSQIVAEMFKAKDFCLYDNEKLINSIVELLAIWFDPEEIRHYMFVLNFGKVSDEEDFESIEEFYDRLTRNL